LLLALRLAPTRRQALLWPPPPFRASREGEERAAVVLIGIALTIGLFIRAP